MITPPLTISPRGHSDMPEYREGRPLLRAERGWIISGDEVWLARAAQRLGRLAERAGNVLLVSFGNSVGQIDVPGLGLIEVRSGKWGDSHFEQMLADISRIATGLPFTVDQPTSFPYDRSVIAREDVLYHLFVYLRHVLSPGAPRDEQLLPALQTILQQPHTRFEQERHEVRLTAASRIDARSLMRIAMGVGVIERAEGSAAATPLARVLHGRLPRVIDERRVLHSADTPENRFVKSFLQLALGIVERIRRSLDDVREGRGFRERLRADCDQIEKLLTPLAQHRLWAEVGAMAQLPAASTVLQGRRGYREVYRHFVRLRLATHIPLNPAKLRDLLEARDIARLYELWTYFTMAQALEDLLGKPQRAISAQANHWQYKLKQACELRWSGGVRLRYNPTYSRGQGAEKSYSVRLRPDIALHVGGSYPRTHFFDAKFRLDPSYALPISDDEESAEELEVEVAEERRGTFKKADLYKMHTYRDALRDAGSVWILYPGTDSRFFTTEGERLNLPESIPARLEGVGAMALRPELDGDTMLRQIVQHLLHRH